MSNGNDGGRMIVTDLYTRHIPVPAMEKEGIAEKPDYDHATVRHTWTWNAVKLLTAWQREQTIEAAKGAAWFIIERASKADYYKHRGYKTQFTAAEPD